MAKIRGKPYLVFPNNEHCDYCPERKYYIENGFQYCKNGHQIKDWHEVDEQGGDHFLQQGHVTRKQKEVKERAKKHLTGPIARELFLECLQVVLRKQLAWLIHNKGLPVELETVVRDLWDLRIRNLEGIRGDEDTYGTKTRRGSSAGGSRLTSEERLFSSQAVPENDDDSASNKGRKVDLEWSGENWVVPRVRETLGLCYLGCVLLREPVRLGDIYKWVRSGQMPYFRTAELLPSRLRERLPSYGQRLLMAMPSSLEPSDLHETTTELMLGFRKNWDVSFPCLNVPPLLALYLRDLAIPPHLYTHVEHMVPLLGLEFSFPSRKQRVESYESQRFRMLDNPDALLAGCVVLATKYLFPLDNNKRYPSHIDDPLSVRMDWEVWCKAFRNHGSSKIEFEMIKSGQLDVWTLTPEEQDAYMDWEQATFLKPLEGCFGISTCNHIQAANNITGNALQQCFPAEAAAPRQPPTAKCHESDDRLAKVLGAISWLPPKLDTGAPSDFGSKVLRIGQKHPRFKHAEDLSGATKQFYDVVADISGLSLSDLAQTVYNIEQLLTQWAARVRKSTMTGMEGDDGGDDDLEGEIPT